MDMFVRDGGNVGIGTPNPTNTLSVQGQIAFMSGSAGVNLPLYLGRTTTDATIAVAGGVNQYGMGAAAGDLILRSEAQKVLIGSAGLTTATFLPNGNVGIGTTAPLYKLAVNGTIGTKEVIVTNTGWSDYVFRPDYYLRPLSEVGAFVKEHHHLPEIPSEAEVKEKGVSLGDMQAKLLAKIEELTLHMIKAEERSNRLERENRDLQGRIARLEDRNVKGDLQLGREGGEQANH